jgi:tetratricopeptide (TPR) repeat protein
MRNLRELEADALTAQRLENWSAALALWSTILADRPNWEGGYGYYYLADCYTRLGQLDSAEEAYRRAISIAPEDSLFSEALGSLVEARKLGHI